MNILNAQKRSKTDKLFDLRKKNLIPAVVYGAGIENTSVSVSDVEFEKVWKNIGESGTAILDIAGKKIDVLIHEVSYEPVKGNVLHVDFLAIDMNKPVKVAIQLVFSGLAPAE